MAKLEWDQVGQKFFETGVDHGAFYPVNPATGKYESGVAWNGLISVTESPSGAEATKLYADNIKYLSLLSAEDFGGTINAYYYPPEFEICDGTAQPIAGVTVAQQARRTFGFVYRTKIGNDTAGQELGYKLHIVYGALASPSEKTRNTVNESPSAVEFSWTFTTTPVPVSGYNPTAHLILDSTKIPAAAMLAVEEKLFGTSTAEPTLLMPDDLIDLVRTNLPEDTE